MATQTFEYFFDLPPELREQILEHICVFPAGILVGGSIEGGNVCLRIAKSTANQHATNDGDGIDGENNGEEDENNRIIPADPPLDLFLASPILYRHAGDLYYGQNVFHLDIAAVAGGRGRYNAAYDSTSSYYSGGPTPTTMTRRGRLLGNCRGVAALVRLLTHPDTAPARRRIRSAVVLVRRFGGLVTDVLVPALGDMVLNGALRRLTVDVIEASGVTESEPLPRDPVGNPALRAVLVLLADPDMERAALRVARELHASDWCRFHEKEIPWASGRRRPCAVSGRRDARFLEVDLHKLADACFGDSAEFRIMKVEEQGRRP